MDSGASGAASTDGVRGGATRRIGKFRAPGRVTQLCAARVWRRWADYDRRGTASRDRTTAAAKGRAVCPQRPLPGRYDAANPAENRAEHGREDHVSAAGGAERVDAAHGIIRAGKPGAAAAHRPNFYTHRRSG